MRLLKRRGVELDASRRNRNYIDEDEIADIKKSYKKGESVTKLTLYFGTTHSRITPLLHSNGARIDKKRRVPKRAPEILIPLGDILPHYTRGSKTFVRDCEITWDVTTNAHEEHTAT